ncbi:Major facilitator superfamily protein [Striga hermonthica]|uniref:Major facilitator superfamily protein n=1 Tax=Striga hermonthica TaxID=68872 RepID=A0A9N7RCZ3_STRHE|nr:Major facilitator superfamily protein [Striga hermonthica]
MMRSETATLVLVNLAGIMERADESLLPGVYKEVGAALHADPTRLGSLTLFRSIVQSSCYPLAAYLAVRHNRAHVIAAGAFLWAAATFLVAFSSTFAEVAISRGLNGIGLAIVTPAIQSLVADSTDDTNRGTAFGWLQLTGNLGSIIGGLISVLLASTSFLGVPGWRLAFHLVGLLSVFIGILVCLFATDPRAFDNLTHQPPKTFRDEVRDLMKEARDVIRVPTFQILVAQGVSGSFPWSSMSFVPMWLELMGFSHGTTAVILTVFSVAGSLGGLFGGKMGDVLAVQLPNAGRIIMSQVSSGSAIPLAAILLLGLPDDPSTAWAHGFVFFVLGLFASWNAPATNNPIFAEIVPKRARTSIYALDRSFESILASFAPPVVGFLAQHAYGFKPPSKDSDGSKRIDTDRENAKSLGKALYTAIGIPMAICCVFYSFLYCTYPQDRDRAKMDALIESEMREIESNGSDLVLGSYGKEESTAIDMDYNERDNFHENDKRRLLSRELTSSDASKL